VYEGKKITARMPAYTAVPGRRHPQYADWLLVQREGKTCEVEAKYFISEADLERELNTARRDLLEKKRELEEASFDRDLSKRAYRYEFYLANSTCQSDSNANRAAIAALATERRADLWHDATAAGNRAETLKAEIKQLEKRIPELEKLESPLLDLRKQP
jgi:hypothetical protein